jgi:aspartate/glutamate/glutamine transport system substrate-binding protein
MGGMGRPVRRLGLWAGVVALIALAACGEEPTPPALTGFVPANPSVTAGESVDIRVEYEANDFTLDAFQWTAEAGEIEGNGKPAITWRAPDTPGDYALTVTTASPQDGLPDLTLSTMVEVLPAPEPAVSEAPAAGTPAVDQSAGQKAAAAARAALQGSGSDALQAGEEAADAAQAEVESAGKEVAELGREAAEAARVEGGRSDAAAAPPAGERPAQSQSTGERPAGAASKAPVTADGVETIVARGRLVAVVENDFAPFSYEEDGRRVGFEVDMMREFARRWLGDGDAVTFVPVTADQRIATLQAGNADLIAAALTRTAEREAVLEFSQTYFKDGQRILVGEDAEIAGPCDLAGKKVAALAGTTSLDNIRTEAAACGFDIESDLVVLERQDQAVAALLEGEVAAFTSDGVALERLAEGQPLKVVGNHFSEEPYGFGIARGEDRLRRLVDLTLAEMDRDGTYAAIYQKWFGDDLSPYPLEADPGLAGDERLSTIAGKHFGDVGRGAWRAIWEANRATIGDDPNRIRVGMRLTLPSSL